MSSSLEIGTARAVAVTADSTRGLRNLYCARFGFALGWAVLVTLSAATLGPVSIALLVIYPLVDVAATAIDFRASGTARPRAPLYITMASSLLTALAVAVAATSGVPDVLRVWGVWAIVAGIAQLYIAILRYRLGGQGAMILSGGISTLAGLGFLASAGAPDASLIPLGGYATLGGIFFLISAIRLHSRANETR